MVMRDAIGQFTTEDTEIHRGPTDRIVCSDPARFSTLLNHAACTLSGCGDRRALGPGVALEDSLHPRLLTCRLSACRSAANGLQSISGCSVVRLRYADIRR